MDMLEDQGTHRATLFIIVVQSNIQDRQERDCDFILRRVVSLLFLFTVTELDDLNPILPDCLRA